MWAADKGRNLPAREDVLRALKEKQGDARQERLTAAAVAVCGLGGLGSNIAAALARAGVGRLILIDFDRVELTNLNRQQYFVHQIGRLKTEALAENLQAMAPYVELECHAVRLSEDLIEGLLGQADVVCEAFDRPEDKAMLVNGVLERFPEKYLVAASGMAGFGSANEIKTRRVAPHFYLCGDERADADAGLELVSARVLLCAAHQAHMVLRLLTGEETP